MTAPPTPYITTDVGNAEQLVARYGSDLRFTAELGWLTWDGRRWSRDESGTVIGFAIRTMRDLLREAVDIDDRDRSDNLMHHARRSEARRSLDAMAFLAQHMLFASLDTFDRDPFALTVLNGTVDLTTGELRPHCRTDHCTKLAPVHFDPEATCPIFKRFLADITNGNVELQTFLQRWAGYCLTGDTREQVMAIWHGSGSNGKTTLAELLASILGDYAATTPATTFLTRASGSIPNDVAALRGARLVLMSEADEGSRFAESLVKEWVGGDRITARFLHREWFSFTPVGKLVLRTNHRPSIRGTDHAIWRRIRLAPFTVTIPDDQQDRTLLDRLRAESSGVLNWCVQGCVDWQRKGLGFPEVVQQATQEYRADEDVVGPWLEECCVLDDQLVATAKDLRESYLAWCQENGDIPVSQKAVASRLKERGLERERTTHGYRWRGIAVMGRASERVLPGLATADGRLEHEP